MAEKRMLTIAMKAGFVTDSMLADFLDCPPKAARSLLRKSAPTTSAEVRELAYRVGCSEYQLLRLLREAGHRLER